MAGRRCGTASCRLKVRSTYRWAARTAAFPASSTEVPWPAAAREYAGERRVARMTPRSPQPPGTRFRSNRTADRAPRTASRGTRSGVGRRTTRAHAPEESLRQRSVPETSGWLEKPEGHPPPAALGAGRMNLPLLSRPKGLGGRYLRTQLMAIAQLPFVI